MSNYYENFQNFCIDYARKKRKQYAEEQEKHAEEQNKGSFPTIKPHVTNTGNCVSTEASFPTITEGLAYDNAMRRHAHTYTEFDDYGRSFTYVDPMFDNMS